jgi:hypothetical protein
MAGNESITHYFRTLVGKRAPGNHSTAKGRTQLEGCQRAITLTHGGRNIKRWHFQIDNPLGKQAQARCLTLESNESRTALYRSIRWNPMSTKLAIFAAALIVASPVFAAATGNSGGVSSTAPSSSTGPVHSGSSGGESHGGGSAAGGGYGHGGASLGDHGAARAIAANMDHAVAANAGHAVGVHTARADAGKHAQIDHSTAKMNDMHHHRHPFRHEPGLAVSPQIYFNSRCFRRLVGEVWSDCFGATKSRAMGAADRSTGAADRST